MKRGRRALLILCGGGVLLACVVWLALPGEREPEYQGRKLSEWVGKLEFQSPSVKTTTELREIVQEVIETRTTIRHMGTNVVPWLVRWLAYERPAWQRQPWAVNAVSKVPVASFRHWAIGRDSARADAAVLALGGMGPEAESAVPALTKLMHDDRRPDSRNRAIRALGSVGEAGFAPLFALLKEKLAAGDLHVASLCADGIVLKAERESVLASAMPALLFGAATRGPFLTTNGIPSFPVEQLRGNRAFIPAVTKCLTHTNAIVRSEATNALMKLAPEVLTNGVAK